MPLMSNIYMTPSELAWELEQRGVKHHANYYRAMRRYSIRIGDSPFVGNCAKPNDVLDWLQRNPDFRQAKAGKANFPMYDSL